MLGAAAGRSIPALYATCYLVARSRPGLGDAAVIGGAGGEQPPSNFPSLGYGLLFVRP